MLEETLKTSFVQGSNLKGEAAAGNWIYLLPDLRLGRVVCIGRPSAELRRALLSFADELRIVSVRAIAEVGKDTVDLAVVRAAPSTRRGRRMLQQQIERVLTARGSAYSERIELQGWQRAAWPCPSSPNERADPALRLLELGPLSGEMHAAAPADDGRSIRYLMTHGLCAGPTAGSRIARVMRPLWERPWLLRRLRRRASLWGPGMAGEGPPSYLIALLGNAAGIEPTSAWAYAAPGAYRSKKLLFFLFRGERGEPEVVVKMTREAQFNGRLENERRALEHLAGTPYAAAVPVPHVVFSGEHAGLALLGQSAVHGADLRARTTGAPDCPVLLRAIGALSTLASCMDERGGAEPEEAAAVLSELLGRAHGMYGFSAHDRAFLLRQIQVVAASGVPLPLVFQHGDAGTWNAVVSEDGAVGFLDWEAAEPRGVPLWDLFYFLRSYGVLAARRKGERDALRGFASCYLNETSHSRMAAEAIARLRGRIGLDAALVEPLFYFCWVHRALKEASRTPAARLPSAHYISLLRRCIADSGAPGLRVMLGR